MKKKKLTKREKKARELSLVGNRPDDTIINLPDGGIGIINKIRAPFLNLNLLEEIRKELDKDHKEDDNLKMTNFLIAVSGLLKNPKRRMSGATTADSSVGKDNMFKAIMKHMPTGSAIFLTRATEATLEDDIADKRIIAYSELNKFREDGINKKIVETIKQLTEGGTSALKKDIRTGMREARHDEGEQKTVFYGTTEEQRDEELETRFLCGGMKYTYNRGKIVNENTLDEDSDINKLLNSFSEEDSWIKKGLNHFYYEKEQYDDVLIPYANLLKEIEGEPVFNYEDPRSQRDIKRLMGITRAVTWLFQEQRKSFTIQGKNILVSEPIDFLAALKYSEEFFNESYTGIDARNLEILEVMKKYVLTQLSDDVEKWVPRDYIEKETKKAKNTIKHRMGILADKGLVEGIKGIELNQMLGTSIYDANKIYYKRCQKGVKKVLIRCQFSKIKNKLKQFSIEKLTPFCYDLKKIDTLTDTLFTQENKDFNGIYTEGVNFQKNVQKSTKKPKIDTLELTPSDSTHKLPKIITAEEYENESDS